MAVCQEEKKYALETPGQEEVTQENRLTSDETCINKAPALAADDAHVDGSAQSSTLSASLQVVAKASFHRCGTSLPSPYLIFGVHRSYALAGIAVPLILY